MSDLTGSIRSALSACLVALCIAAQAYAGPVPGKETVERAPVDFPLPPSVKAFEIGGNQYEVTFTWSAGPGIKNPGIAGTFNNWNRGATPMKADEKGVCTATLKLAAGEYEYKFISGDNGWHADPNNPAKAGDNNGGDNSILKLGIFAKASASRSIRGDSRIEPDGILHDPKQYTYYDPISMREAIIRIRTLANDVETAVLVLRTENGVEEVQRLAMSLAGSDSTFDYYEAHVILPLEALAPAKRPGAYTFILRDANAAYSCPKSYALDFSAARRVQTPEWAKRAIWYQIAVDRFRNGDPANDAEKTLGTGRVARTSKWNGDYYAVQPWEKDGDKDVFHCDGDKTTTPDVYERLYGGDFQGLIDKLDYIKGLGVNAIYLNPIFEATSAIKYNAKSFMHADDGYGMPGSFAQSAAKEDFFNPKTWELNASDRKFLELIKEAKKRGFHVIIDGVFNHLGGDAIPVTDLRAKGKASKFAGWYDVTKWEPNIEISGWGGFGGLPQFKKNDKGFADPTLRDHVFAITRRWLDPNGDGDPSDGVDGWRLDVPFEVPKPFWQEWRGVVKSVNPNAYIVGEVWDPAESWLDGGTFDAVMNYQFRLACLKYFGNKQKKTKASEFDHDLARLRMRYPRECTYVMQNLLDSHDTDRIASRMMNPDLEDKHYDGANRKQDNGPNYNDSRPNPEAYQRVKLLALFQAGYIGAPMIFYGTEVGMYGADDPVCRMPMWWDDLMPYDNKDYVILEDLRSEYKALFALRNSQDYLSTGDYRTLLADDAKDVFVFARYAAEGKTAVVFALNNSAQAQTVSVPAPWKIADAPPKMLHGKGAAEWDSKTVSWNVRLEPISGAAFLVTLK